MQGAPATFRIQTTQFDSYALGYRGETHYATEKLVWTATVTPAQGTLSEAQPSASGVAFTVTGVVGGHRRPIAGPRVFMALTSAGVHLGGHALVYGGRGHDRQAASGPRGGPP